MIKNLAIAILAGIVVADRLTSPGDPARGAAIVCMSDIVFFALLWLECQWDKHHRGIQSRIKWYMIIIRTMPAEIASRKRRIERMRECVKELQEQHLIQERRDKQCQR